MLLFHENNRHFCILNMVRLNPAAYQPLACKAEDAPVVYVVIRYVQPLLQLKQNGKQPLAICIKAGLFMTNMLK